MKTIKKFRIIIIVLVMVAVVAFRLASNKHSFNDELKMVSESNTTIPILTDTVKYIQMEKEFSVNGSFSPAQEISIMAETQGKIISLHVKNGETIGTGQVLATIDGEIAASQLELARFNLEKAEKNRDRYQQLSKSEAATTLQYESARQEFVNSQAAFDIAKKQFAFTTIKAPFGGVITKQYVEKGSYLTPGAPVFDMVSIQKVKFIAKLTGEEVEKIKKGQAVKINVDAYPGTLYEGVINAMVVKSDLSKRYEVEVLVSNQLDKLIKPGMFGNAIFVTYSDEKHLVIPRNALTGSIKSPEIFIVKGDSIVTRSITAVPLNEHYVTVTSGLEPGDVIVTSGQISLVNGSKIKITK